MSSFWTIDAVPLAAASLAALSCALVGNFLILTRRAMAADALSHAIVPGIVIAVALTGQVAAPIVIAGGLIAAFAAGALTSFLARTARVEPATALGVVFTTFFAAGIVILERSGLARTAFDIHHVVTGHLEGLIWVAGTGPASLLDPAALATLPPAIGVLAAVFAIVAVLIVAFRKELAIAAFDPVFAEASGLSMARLDALVLGATALAAIAAFEAVGVVLAVAMIVCPPATARLMTRSLGSQIALSLVIAQATVLAGYGLAAFGPALFGSTLALNAAGTIGATSGLVLALAAAFSRSRRSDSAMTT